MFLKSGVEKKFENSKWYSSSLLNNLFQYISLSKIFLYIFFLIRFESTSHQARRLFTLRQNGRVFAVLQYCSGNTSISNETITTIVEFYREDGVSRVSSNLKDIIQINQNKVPIGFMEMSVLDAFRLIDKRFPGLIGRTTFY